MGLIYTSPFWDRALGNNDAGCSEEALGIIVSPVQGENTRYHSVDWGYTLGMRIAYIWDYG